MLTALKQIHIFPNYSMLYLETAVVDVTTSLTKLVPCKIDLFLFDSRQAELFFITTEKTTMKLFQTSRPTPVSLSKLFIDPMARMRGSLIPIDF